MSNCLVVFTFEGKREESSVKVCLVRFRSWLGKKTGLIKAIQAKAIPPPHSFQISTPA